mgnify:CR=1 FL=1
MTEYWVSQARHWCEYCRIYIAGNKSSIAFHENGKKHKEIVELSLRDMRMRGRERRIEQSDLQKEMDKIERNALKDYMHHDVAKEARPAAKAEVPADRAARLAELEARMTADRMARAFSAAAGGGALPAGWRAMTNPDGKVFFMNDENGAMQWEKPGAPAATGAPATGAPATGAPASGAARPSASAARPSAQGASSSEPPPATNAVSGGWQQGYNEQGLPYYYHVERALTQWEPPPEWLGGGGGSASALGSSGGGGGGGGSSSACDPAVHEIQSQVHETQSQVHEHAEALPTSQHEIQSQKLEMQSQQLEVQPEREQKRYREELEAAADADAGAVVGAVDVVTGLGAWTAVETGETPEGGWGYDRPSEKRQRVAWATNRKEEEEEDEAAALDDLKVRLPVSEEMQRAVALQQASEAAAAEAALHDAPAAVFAKRKVGSKGIRVKKESDL